MKLITLGKSAKKPLGFSVMVDDEDYDHLNLRSWHYCHGYAVRSGGRRGSKLVYMHKVVLGLGDCIQGDHISGNKLDNRKCNLRPATHRQNHRNKPKMSTPTTSQYKGVSWVTSKGKWISQIRVDGELFNLGAYTEERWAAMAYDIAAKELCKEFASLNFPAAIH